MSLDGFSMYPLAEELHRMLCGGRIDKIAQPNKQLILLSIRQPGANFWLHISINPQNPAAYIAPNHLENPAAPPVFCMVLRKQIETGRISRIYQYELDRLLILDIDFLAAGGKIVTKSLVIELMGKYSNIILVQEHKILDALRKVGTTNSRVRTVLPGQEYLPPPAQKKYNLFKTPPGNIIQSLCSTPGKKLSKALLDTCLGFGPVSCHETICRARLQDDLLVENLDVSAQDALINALQSLQHDISKPSAEACFVLNEQKKLLAMSAFPLHYLPLEKSQSFSSISEMLAMSTKFIGGFVLPDKDRFKKLVRSEIARAENKSVILRNELTDAENAAEQRIKADNLMTYQHSLKDHLDHEITVPNIYSDTGELITIDLDIRISIMQNVQAYYHKYDKLKRAQELLKIQLEQCLQELDYLASIEISLTESSSLAEINEIRTELINSGYLKEKLQKKTQDKPSLPFEFHTADGIKILVGKNNYQNDKLTFRMAHAKDLWFHTKDIPGSHVILRCEDQPPSEDTIFLAACIAAHFSKARESSKIPVDYTLCRFVKKPSGAKPGFVNFTNQKTLYVTPDKEMLQHILKNDWNTK